MATLLQKLGITKKVYMSCPDHHSRMTRIAVKGHDLYSLVLCYNCEHGCDWAYCPYTNSMTRDCPQEGGEQ